PGAVDVTVGDLVLDEAANKHRDVDITVTLQEDDRTVRAFKAYEVKRESDALDVATVEGLCMKLRDMPAVTQRAIVLASGFTDGAIEKGTKHGVELFVFKAWTEGFGEQFPEFKDAVSPDKFLSRFYSNLLCWVDAYLRYIVPSGPPSFTLEDSTTLFASNGSV